ncbi:MAG TPA: hypothetical protein VM050_10730 [Patescibacteria group bacterium]|nr:hypothetical protein [Patescibacteria group bacterium]
MPRKLATTRKGLAQVVTTLMLLVFSILLSGIAIYYSINIVSVRLQTEEVRVTKEEIWVNSTGAVGAFRIQNLGGRDILIDKIEIRGVTETWSDVFFNRLAAGTSVNADLNVTSYDNLTGQPVIDGRMYNPASNDIPLGSGLDLLIYIKGPDNVQMEDIGTTVSISVHTMNAQYITECNVKSAS